LERAKLRPAPIRVVGVRQANYVHDLQQPSGTANARVFAGECVARCAALRLPVTTIDHLVVHHTNRSTDLKHRELRSIPGRWFLAA